MNIERRPIYGTTSLLGVNIILLVSLLLGISDRMFVLWSYWLETLIVFVYTIVRISLSLYREKEKLQKFWRQSSSGLKLILFIIILISISIGAIIFFMLFFGTAFMLTWMSYHGGYLIEGPTTASTAEVLSSIPWKALLLSGVGFAISHGISFLEERAKGQTNLFTELNRSKTRLLFLVAVLAVGAFTKISAILLVVAKTVADITRHSRMHL